MVLWHWRIRAYTGPGIQDALGREEVRMDRDMYGINRDDAAEQLSRFLHETLQEPQAELEDLHLEDGRWQSHVRNSQRGITDVFLLEHNGVIAPGHFTMDAHTDTPNKW
jgi:hypothetical protein